jgi:hypothetical protein
MSPHVAVAVSLASVFSSPSLAGSPARPVQTAAFYVSAVVRDGSVWCPEIHQYKKASTSYHPTQPDPSASCDAITPVALLATGHLGEL